MLQRAIVLAILKNNGVFADLHTIVSGTIDADRIDFVRRDAKNAGFGADLEYRRLIDGVRIFMAPKQENRFLFAFPEKALNSIEMFLRKRFENYRTVIYHHNVVKSDTLMRAVIFSMGQTYFSSDTNQEKLANRKEESDNNQIEITTIPRDISGLWFPLQMELTAISINY